MVSCDARLLWGNLPVPLEERGVLMVAPTDTRQYRLCMCWPSWADRKQINAFYAERDRLTRITGRRHEVDHIVPISHPNVCGLHCPANLRVVEGCENLSKSNYHWPDMWNSQMDFGFKLEEAYQYEIPLQMP